MEINSNAMKLTLLGMYASMMPSIQQVELSIVNEQIEETRGLIISGEKTKEEMNELLDKLQRLSVKKRDIESLMKAIKRSNEVIKKIDEKEEHDEKLTKLTSEEEEA